MKAAETAKSHGVRSLKSLSESTGFNADTLRRLHRNNPQRYRILCLGSVCDELNVDGQRLREIHALISEIKKDA